MIDIRFENALPPKRGRVLISDPFKNEDYFERSVIYICEHDEESTFGFVLNKPITIAFHELNQQFNDRHITAYKGGPCDEDTLFFLHTLGHKIKGSQHISNGIYLGSNYTSLYQQLTPELIEEGAIKLIIGYSGWSPGQLQEELDQNMWAISEVESLEELMLPTDDLWRYFMKKLGNKYELMTKFPLDPNAN